MALNTICYWWLIYYNSSLIFPVVSPTAFLMIHLDICLSECVVGGEDQFNFEHEKYEISIRYKVMIAEVEKWKGPRMEPQDCQYLGSVEGRPRKEITETPSEEHKEWKRDIVKQNEDCALKSWE